MEFRLLGEVPASRHVTPNLHRDWVIVGFGSRNKTFPKVEKLWTGWGRAEVAVAVVQAVERLKQESM